MEELRQQNAILREENERLRAYIDSIAIMWTRADLIAWAEDHNDSEYMDEPECEISDEGWAHFKDNWKDSFLWTMVESYMREITATWWRRFWMNR
jgi:hypothetical protein